MKPYFKLKLPFDTNELLAPTFDLPTTEYDEVNPYIPVGTDAFGNSINCSTHNRWIHRFSGPTPGQSYVPILDILHPTLVNFFADRGLNIGAIFIFYACPGSYPGGIHSDWGVETKGRIANFAINWTVGELGKHDMMWYEPNNKELIDGWWPIDAVRASLSYPIPTFKRDTVTEVARYSIDSPTLVRTDIPHNAENYSQTSRWCFSIRTDFIPKNWEQVYKMFKDIIEE
jgi:hypothetical protein